ncbi:ImmA/IrrE family metallo-endopeptidase [Anaerostipes faecalis]|uniref:ImmA/IrrE family metallo-endopeptidase n=1 Tax=Anaerostipes faecalis TaxID=2738446 RepID=UPI003F074A87
MANCIAEPLSRKDIRHMAQIVRTIEGSSGDLFFDIAHFLEVTLPRIDEDFSFVVKTKEEMGDCHGLTFPDRNEIQIREDVYQRACDGSGRDRLTMAHELFHLLQHTRENISFARSEGQMKTYMDPEWQADAFGGELLIPYDLITGMSVEEISRECMVSMSAARCQMAKK